MAKINESKLRVEWVPIGSITPYENNPRINDEAVDKVASSIMEFGWQQPIVIDEDRVVIVGHTRLKAAHRLGLEKVPVTIADNLTPAQVKAYRLADNKTSELSEWNLDALGKELDGITEIDMAQFGFDDSLFEGYDDRLDEAEREAEEYGGAGILKEKFIVPPFSVLDARQDYWQERVRAWRDTIGGGGPGATDPVLCEIMCKWFLPFTRNALILGALDGDETFRNVSERLGARYEHQDAQKDADLLFARADRAGAQGEACGHYAQETAEALAKACGALRDNRFAIVQTEDARDPAAGGLINAPNTIKKAIQATGLKFYNELILIDRTEEGAEEAADFGHTRRLAQAHKKILVFYKGNPNDIRKVFPIIEVPKETDTAGI